MLVALTFIGLPFVVRTLQPVLEDLSRRSRRRRRPSARRRWQTFTRVILPILTPALLTGFALAFARALGEYGSVIFIAGNMPMVSEITPLIIITKLEQYDYAGATAIAVVMLVAVVRAAAGDQRPAGLDARERQGAMSSAASTGRRRRRSSADAGRRAPSLRVATAEPAWVRRTADRPSRWPS